MNSKIWLSSPHMGGNELKYIHEAFDANWVAPLGPNVDGFEKDLAQFLGENVNVAALSAGTAALHLALIIFFVKPGDEVICHSFTFSTSANPIKYWVYGCFLKEIKIRVLTLTSRESNEKIKI